MFALRLEAVIAEDRLMKLQLPPDVPTGRAEVVLIVNPTANGQQKRPRSSLADWAEANAEHWGSQLDSGDVDGFTGRRF